MKCCICYTNKYVTITNCTHVICVNCLLSLHNMTCPMCRKDLKNELPPLVKQYLLNKNNKIPTKRPFYMRINDINEFPPLQ